MINYIVTADIIYIVQESKQLFFRCSMKYCVIMFKCSYIMDFIIFQANLNIHYGIIADITTWHSECIITDGIIPVIGFPDSHDLAPY